LTGALSERLIRTFADADDAAAEVGAAAAADDDDDNETACDSILNGALAWSTTLFPVLQCK
jgi:hypothetical protein